VNAKNFFAELKRRNVYKVAIAGALVRVDHVARFIVKVTHSVNSILVTGWISRPA
jgi:hypothetical protein